jgi:ketosteroid isomerase-like protein
MRLAKRSLLRCRFGIISNSSGLEGGWRQGRGIQSSIGPQAAALLLAMSVFMPVAGRAQTVAGGATAAVRSVLESRFNASYAKSANQLDRLYGDNPNLLIIRDGNVIRGWDAYRSYWAKALGHLPSGFTVHFRVVELHVSQHQAWAACRWRTSYRGAAGRPVMATGFMTLVLAHRGSVWQVVYEHISTDSRSRAQQ